ncbi:hypothetical protein [Acinetobacter bereziniae]|uniref:hypothetical protein n=1 Tax=Acinetobacter bereziniae TaxID=106648 RepID=UPI0018FF3CA9|nr:hypothetical protein [Acinetobacter bereziniae]MBJ8476474.1 hypothetical protein [Acinetobacter bereziniae]
MFSSKLFKNISIFVISYLALTMLLFIVYFYLGDIYHKDLGLSAKDAAKWSRYDLISIFSGVGVFMAPIAVFIGFNAWKKQQFESSKISILEEIKIILTKQNMMTVKYRLQNNLSLLHENRHNEFRKREKEWSDNFESYRVDIMSLLQNKGFYFGENSKELKKLYELNNNTFDVITIIEGAAFSLETTMNGIGKIIPYEGEEDDQHALKLKRMYILNPNWIYVQDQLKKDKDLEKACKEFELNYLNKYSDEYFNYLNQLLNNLYK